jgi:hypothetical protein
MRREKRPGRNVMGSHEELPFLGGPVTAKRKWDPLKNVDESSNQRLLECSVHKLQKRSALERLLTLPYSSRDNIPAHIGMGPVTDGKTSEF